MNTEKFNVVVWVAVSFVGASLLLSDIVIIAGMIGLAVAFDRLRDVVVQLNGFLSTIVTLLSSIPLP